MNMTSPKFRLPPVVEAFSVIYFRDLLALNVPHLGLFWDMVKDKFPRTQTLPRLPPMFLLEQGQQVFLEADSGELPRTLFVSADETQLLQIQRDRIIYNWKKACNSSEYPSFGVLKVEFFRLYDKFSNFAADMDVADPINLTGAEFGYVNILEEGRDYKELGSITDVLPIFKGVEGVNGQCDGLSALNSSFKFEMPGKKGSLYVSVQSPFLANKRATRLDVASRWIKAEANFSELKDWLEIAHDETVNMFTRVTHPEIQRTVWGRYQ